MCVALLLLVPSFAAAQKNQLPPLPPSTITLEINGLNCSTAAGIKIESWSWGASNSGQVSGGTSAGKASLQDLHVVKAFDSCSPALLGLVTNGLVVKQVKLTQTASDTKVELEGVRVSSWNLSSSTAQSSPWEQVSFNFQKVCVTDTASSTTVCYDSVVQQ